MLSAASGPSEPSGFRVIEADDAHVAIAYSNLIVVIWYHPPRAEMLHQLYVLAHRLTVECQVEKVSVVSIVQSRIREPPSPAARAALSMLHSDPKKILHRSALVFVNEGFVVASIRSVILGVRNKLSGSSNNDMFKEFEPAARWAMDGLVGPERRGLPVLSVIAEVNRYLATLKSGSNER